MKFAGYVARKLTYKVLEFGSNSCRNIEVFMGGLLANAVYLVGLSSFAPPTRAAIMRERHALVSRLQNFYVS